MLLVLDFADDLHGDIVDRIDFEVDDFENQHLVIDDDLVLTH
jgi:hypothetical protein